MPLRLPFAPRRTRFLLPVLLAAALARPAAAGSIPVLDSITVVARRVTFGASAPVSSREDLNRSLEALGVLAVRRGVGLGSDLHADGFRRADLAVVVDGERFHCACPNRMDPPTSLAIPIELASATWDRTSEGIGAGLGGRLSLRREVPAREFRARAALEGDLVRSRDGHATFALEGAGQRLSGRAMAGRSYADGGGATFRDRYGYRDANVDYAQGDLAWRGRAGAWGWGVQGSLTRDVPYAYLLMDERTNELWNASVEHAGTKAYVNHSRHLMDNGLRASPVRMTTAADQTTVGLTARFAATDLEAWGREWNANNTIATPMSRVGNHMIPRFRQWSLAAARRLARGPVRVDARLGVTRAGIGDGARLATYRVLAPDARGARTFVPFALAASRTFGAGGRWAALAEVASEPPTAEQLWIVVRRPLTNPRKADWVGDPELRAPWRGSVRGQWGAPLATLEAGGSWVGDYVLPEARFVSGAPYLTNRNVDAALLSGRASGRLARTEWSLAWTLGWNLTDRTPLAEIAPFVASAAWRPALAPGLEGLVRGETAARQSRVDAALGESSTPAWARLDLGLRWSVRPGATLALEVDNVTDALYGEHLSFVRDPFAAGLRVMDPGRTVRLSVSAGD